MDKAKEETSPKPINFFEDLTPQVIESDARIIENLEALNYAIEKSSIKNIALTGSYGSGKSSILKTLENNHPEHQYLRISLASFNDPDSSAKEKVVSQTKKIIQSQPLEPKINSDPSNPKPKNIHTQENLERLLELSILQQIFYHVNHDKIPDSRFKRIISLGRDTILNFQIASIIWVMSAWYLFFPNSLKFESLTYFNKDLLKVFSLILFLVGLAKLLSHFRRVYNNSKVNKLNIQSGEVEIDQEVEQSILNKHIDEIIYFFEVTNYNVVMIEDLDRFENTAIFSKLREINLLINNCQQINRTINFIYAVRDDIFEDSHRTKFFDFFIPVIPVSDPSNATDLLTRSFKRLKQKTPSEDFISDIASFIPDMRFLNNVFNEYLLYESTIKAKLSPEKRFAIILYKNLNPKDFIQLQQGKGMLYTVLRSRNTLVTTITEEINDEISKIKKKLSALKEDLSLQEKELRGIYVNAIQDSVGNSIGVKIGETFKDYAAMGKKETFNEIPRDEALIHKCTDGINRAHSHFRNVKGPSFSNIENLVNPDLSFEERLNQIRNKATENDYKKELARKKNELNRLRHLNLGQLFSKSNNTNNFGDFENDELVIYLLKNGYIDENYISYISHFYEGQITATDYEFYQHIIAGTSNPFDFQLMKTSNLIRKIAPRFFLRQSILNLNLADELIKNEIKFKSKYDLFFHQICNQSETSKEFIIYYAENGQYSSKFLAEIYLIWPSVWKLFTEQSELTKKQQDEILHKLLQEVEIKALLNSITESGIKNYILEDPEILNVLRKVPVSKMQKLISETPIKFTKLDYAENKDNQDLLKYILTSGFWEFTEAMALTACRLYIEPKIIEKEVNESPYTLLSGIDELAPVINNNIQHLTEEMLLEKVRLKEEPEAFLKLLNNQSILMEYRKKIINLQDRSHKVLHLSKVDELEIQSLLLEKGKVEVTWKNVIDYYEEYEKITSSLITFLNDFAELIILDESEISDNTNFKNQLLLCDDLELKSYKFLIPFFFKKPYSQQNFENLSEQKVTFLIEKGILAMEPKVFSFLKQHFERIHIQLAEKFPKEFLSKLSMLSLNTKDLNQIVSSNDFNNHFKYQVISESSEKIPELNTEASQILSTILLKENTLGLNAASIHHLIQSANNEKEAIQLLVKYEEELSEENLKKSILKLPPRFHKILRKRKRLELPRNNDFIDFGSVLERHRIATLKIKTDTIVITGRYK